MPYLLLSKRRQNLNCRLLQIVVGALRVNTLEKLRNDELFNILPGCKRQGRNR